MVVCRWPHGSSGNVQNERLSVIDPIQLCIPRERRESFASKGGREGPERHVKRRWCYLPFFLRRCYLLGGTSYC